MNLNQRAKVKNFVPHGTYTLR